MVGNEGRPPDRPDSDELEGDVFAARVRVSPEQADRLLRSSDYDFGDRPRITPSADGSSTLDLFVSRPQIAALEADGIAVDVGSNQSARARTRIGEMDEGDRYEGGKTAPRGIGRKIPPAGPERPS